MNAFQPDLTRALIDLGEAYEMVNSTISREAERRAEIEPVPRMGVLICMLLLQHGGAAEEELRAMMNESTANVRAALRVLERQEMVEKSLVHGERHYEIASKAIHVRELVQERCNKAIRYALAHLTQAQTTDLENAIGALAALSHGLGRRDIDKIDTP